ncbi:OprD family outer membrane porin [Shewanella sp. A14]
MKKQLLSILVLAVLSGQAYADTTFNNMFSEGSMDIKLRLYDFSRDFDGGTTDKQDTSIGGLFYYKTAEVNGLSFGTTYASINKIWVDDSKAVYSLLARDSDGNHVSINRMQEYYMQGDWFDTKFRLGAQEVASPFMSPHDARGVPRTTRGFTAINNSFDNLTLSAFYITDSMGWDDNNFVKANEAVKAELLRTGRINADTEIADNPVYVLGVKYNLPTKKVKSSASLWNYHMDDVLNFTYAGLKLSTQIGATNVYFNPSYLSQKSIGSETAGAFDTHQYGFHLGAKYAGADLTLLYGKTGDDKIMAPWGDGKVVPMQANQAGNQANEAVKAIKLAYDFGQQGIEGLTAYVFSGQFDASDYLGDKIDETDFAINYKLDKWCKGLSIRARHAIVEKETGVDYNDTRLYLRYYFTIGK